MGKPESKVEQRLVKRVLELGGICDKVRNETRDGWPDRTVIVPHSHPGMPTHIALVETKSDEGNLRKTQILCRDELAARGVTVLYINSKGLVDEYVEFLMEQGYGEIEDEPPPSPVILLQ